MEKKGILERLAQGPVVGDGSMCFILERRGYVRPMLWTPEAVLEHPEAVLQLHREYVRAGADVIQTASYSANEEKLSYLNSDNVEVAHLTSNINEAACSLARKAAEDNNCLICAGLSPSPEYRENADEVAARNQFRKQAQIFVEQNVDLLLAEFFGQIRELEICAEELKKHNKPVAVSMRLGLHGDTNGVSVEECAIRMAKTGADIIGTNCCFDINTSLKIMEKIKTALDEEGLSPYLMCQPLGFHCPDAESCPMGYTELPEYPFGLEPRSMTRMEVHKFARAAFDLGVRYIGGCCGFEPHHIRAIAQELNKERGKPPPVEKIAPAFGKGASKSAVGGERASREYWYNLTTATGRPYSPALSKPFVRSDEKRFL
uniref:betaine--homocysteine S-methyltransferase 1-like n=1 Tax=Styela clava TaxID=7725 RepID=UPI00193A1D94|nr:betaine--homocysteine S-methyltransferase 1-like [Styela clava]